MKPELVSGRLLVLSACAFAVLPHGMAQVLPSLLETRVGSRVPRGFNAVRTQESFPVNFMCVSIDEKPGRMAIFL